jgi:hypothetical protein
MAKAGAAIVCCVLLLGQCSKDPITGAKAAVGGAAVGAGIGVGVAGGAAAGGVASGIKRGAAKRAEGAISGRNRPTPRPPTTTTTRPVPTTTTTRQAAIIRDCVMTGIGVCVVKP